MRSPKNKPYGVIKSEPSGAEKRKKKKLQEAVIKSQAGDIFRYIKKIVEPAENSSFNEEIGSQRDEDKDVNDIGQNSLGLENSDECIETHQYESGNQGEEESEQQKEKDISDPGNWENIDLSFRDLLVENGLTKRLSRDYQYPKDNIGRHFSEAFYTRDIVNGEKQDRRWLIYSKALDKAFCFYCKLFRHEKSGSLLATKGYNDWRNFSRRLKEHEISHDHIICMTCWTELEVRFQKNQTIDKHAQEELNREKSYWREVLLRIFAVVKTLAKRNLTFRGIMRNLVRRIMRNLAFRGMT